MSVLVLMYHGIERRAGPLFIDPQLFAEHLAVFVESGVPVLTVAQIGDLLAAGTLPARAVALTFDDGFATVTDNAAPLLLERGLTATIFCVAGRLGSTNAWPTNPRDTPTIRLASATALSQLAAEGFEIGGHGLQHAPLDTDDPAEIQSEVQNGKSILEQAVGAPIRSFALPYGRAPSPIARRALTQMYEFGCTTRIGRVHPNADPLDFPRVDAHYVRSPELLSRALEGHANVYFALRRVGAAARRRIVRDYSRGGQ